MSAEIKSYPGVSAPETKAQLAPDVIDLLCKLLVDAQRGDIQAIAVALVLTGERTDRAWAHGLGQTAHEMQAAVTDLAFAISCERFHQSHSQD